jgi:fido (protein-threonine AMPylation protein)
VGDQLRSVPTEQYTASLARAHNAVNAIHAFREGNGRTQREFTNAIAHQAGYSIDWTQIPGWLNDAACERGRRGDFGQLEDMFAKIMTRDPAASQAAPAAATRRNLADADTYLSSAERPRSPAANYQPPELPPSRGVSSGPYRLGR